MRGGRRAKYRTTGWFRLFVVLSLPGILGGGEEKAPFSVESRSDYSQTTLLLCNEQVPESVELARYYAAARKIPSENILLLSVDPSEAIDRPTYERELAAPLRELLLSKGWWMPERDPETGEQALRSQFHFLVVFRGLPLRIRPIGEGEEPLRSTAASVDSELAALGHPGSALEGPAQNPYFESELPFHQAGMSIQLVGRIDGPSWESCRDLIDRAIRAEREGVWGNAYIDLAEEGKLGNDWLSLAAERLRSLGVPVTMNRFPQLIPRTYPLKDPAFYFGAGSEKVGGPFADPGFQFRPGAIAAHLAQSSAVSVRDPDQAWAGALLRAGASEVVGNVANPHPPLSHRVHLFTDRLIKGHTLVESAYMASETLSWMGVVLGDPLYRPFPLPEEPVDEEQYGKDEMLPYKVIRLAYGRWGKGRSLPDKELILKLEMASAKIPRPELIEHLGLTAMELGNHREARTHFRRARSKYAEPEDQLRMSLHLADLAWQQNDKLDAMKIWREAADEYGRLPESRAAVEFMKGFQTAQQ